MQRAAQAAPARAGLRRLAPPRSLGILLVIVVIVGVAWALLVPPWQSPDELAHYAYSESLAQTFSLPSRAGHPFVSSDEAFADGSVGASRGAFFPGASPPDWSPADWRHYLAAEHAQPPSKSNGGGPSSASQNPPLYYLLAAVPYLIDASGTAFGRLYAMRLGGVVLLLVTTLAAWMLAGETLGRRRLSQLAAASVAGLLPMATFMSTAVNPDALLMPLWTLALWLGARVINRRAAPGDTLALCAVTAAAILTKATSYALVAPVVLAVLIGWRRRPPAERRRALVPIGASALVLLVPVLGWVALASSLGGMAINRVGTSSAHPFNVRQFLSYVWQFYLPRLPFLSRFRTTATLPAYEIWVRQGAGTFGWLDIYLPDWMYPAAGVVTAVVGVSGVALLSALRRRRHLALLAFFVLALICLLGLLHITDYRAFIAGSGQFMQGRYLLPAIGLLGLAVGLIVTRLPSRVRPATCGLAITLLLGAQAISLAAVLKGYYL